MDGWLLWSQWALSGLTRSRTGGFCRFLGDRRSAHGFPTRARDSRGPRGFRLCWGGWLLRRRSGTTRRWFRIGGLRKDRVAPETEAQHSTNQGVVAMGHRRILPRNAPELRTHTGWERSRDAGILARSTSRTTRFRILAAPAETPPERFLEMRFAGVRDAHCGISAGKVLCLQRPETLGLSSNEETHKPALAGLLNDATRAAVEQHLRMCLSELVTSVSTRAIIAV